MRTGNVFLALAVTAWLALVWLGRDGTYAIYSQQIIGYPSAGQFDYYVMIPTTVATVLLILSAVGNAFRSPTTLKVGAFAGFFALVPYLPPYTGGV